MYAENSQRHLPWLSIRETTIPVPDTSQSISHKQATNHPPQYCVTDLEMLCWALLHSLDLLHSLTWSRRWRLHKSVMKVANMCHHYRLVIMIIICGHMKHNVNHHHYLVMHTHIPRQVQQPKHSTHMLLTQLVRRRRFIVELPPHKQQPHLIFPIVVCQVHELPGGTMVTPLPGP